jgi:hypothetical protein
MDDLEAASFCFLVRLLYAVADGNRDHRVVRSGSVAGDELNDGRPSGDWNLATQPMVARQSSATAMNALV